MPFGERYSGPPRGIPRNLYERLYRRWPAPSSSKCLLFLAPFAVMRRALGHARTRGAGRMASLAFISLSIAGLVP